MLRANVDLKKKRYIPAIFFLQRAEKQAPNNAEIAFRLGKAYWDQGQGQTARKALEKCLKLDPRHLEGLTVRRVIFVPNRLLNFVVG